MQTEKISQHDCVPHILVAKVGEKMMAAMGGGQEVLNRVLTSLCGGNPRMLVTLLELRQATGIPHSWLWRRQCTLDSSFCIQRAT